MAHKVKTKGKIPTLRELILSQTGSHGIFPNKEITDAEINEIVTLAISNRRIKVLEWLEQREIHANQENANNAVIIGTRSDSMIRRWLAARGIVLK